MYIAKNLKRLRLDMGLTQEELAKRVGVTGQAVSKWERDESYPDITLLPGLANCFDVTVDELLGMTEIKGKMWGVYARINTLELEGKYHEAAAALDEAIAVFPADLGLAEARATALALAGEGINQAIEACERLLTGEVSEKRRATTTAILCFLYDAMGATEKAEILARNRPHIHESRELLLPNFMKQSERDAYLREHLPRILTDICNLIEGCTDTTGEKLRQLKLGMYEKSIAPTDAAMKIAEFLTVS